MKKIIYIIFFYLSTFLESYASNVADLFGIDKVDDKLKVGGEDLVFTLNNIMGYIIGLFYFIAVAFGIYGGFLILTSGGEEDKMKKGKNIVLYMIYGLIVIFLASQIVSWIVSIMSDPNIVGPTAP